MGESMRSSPACCPLCRRESALAFRARDYNRRLSQEVFDYFNCQTCGVVFLHPIPADLGRYYPEDYYAIPASAAELAGALPGVRYKLELLRPFAQSGLLLEIGPACGDFALQAKQAGFEVEVIEMDPRCCEFLVRQVGVRATCTADTLGALKGAGPYDVIALWHVIEHLPDAMETLAAAAGRLKPGGVLLIAAPNPESFQLRVLRGRWTHVDAPRHVVMIPLARVVEQAQRGGLEPVFTTTNDEGARGWNRFGWEQSLTNLATTPKAKGRLRKVARRIARMAQPWDRREGKGSAYTVIFRKHGGPS
jgi:2-polyprenyl-3-methyl-5-hydroxy-6-metoxy-1,4-benzoquinol methylase